MMLKITCRPRTGATKNAAPTWSSALPGSALPLSQEVGNGKGDMFRIYFIFSRVGSR